MQCTFLKANIEEHLTNQTPLEKRAKSRGNSQRWKYRYHETLLKIKENHLKQQWWIIFQLSDWRRLKRVTLLSVSKVWENELLLSTACGSGNWHSLLEGDMALGVQTQSTPILWPAISLLGIYPREIVSQVWKDEGTQHCKGSTSGMGTLILSKSWGQECREEDTSRFPRDRDTGGPFQRQVEGVTEKDERMRG